MVDDLARSSTVYTCISCGDSVNSDSIFYCKYQHFYCSKCYQTLKKCYRGNIDGGCTCKICNVSSKFKRIFIDNDKLNCFRDKIKKNQNVFANNSQYPSASTEATYHEKHCRPNVAHVLLRLPKREFNTFREEEAISSEHLTFSGDSKTDFKKHIGDLDKELLKEHKANNTYSRKPLVCPHYSCRKMVAVSSFVSHFKYEHAEIPKFTIERRKDLVLPFSVDKIQYNMSHCLAMITVYDVNKISLVKSRSSQSVIKTCSKFNQTVPINTFWLMVTGSPQERKSMTYAAFWLLANTDDCYKCVIELSSKFDRTSCSSYCNVNTVHAKTTIVDIAKSLNCLLVSRGTFISLLHEGPELNLTVTVH